MRVFHESGWHFPCSRAARMTKRRWLGSAIAILTGVSLSGVARPAGAAATLNVAQANHACSDSGPGSAAQPFCTIGAAAIRAVAGETVLVGTGNYAEDVTPAASGTSGAPIVF